MHIRLRWLDNPDTIIVLESKLTKIQNLRQILYKKLHVPPKLQRLFYGGKMLEDGYTFHDYNIKINDVIQFMVLPQIEDIVIEEKLESKTPADVENNESTIDHYTDAESELYTIGDLIDMRDKEYGAWFEGKIVRIVVNPNPPSIPDASVSICAGSSSHSTEPKEISDDENDLENKPPEKTNDENSNSKKGIAKYLVKSPRVRQKCKRKTSEKELPKIERKCDTAIALLYKVQLDSDEEDSNLYCQEKHIRPRARTIIEPKNLKVGQEVMINYNSEYLTEKGYWYDFKVSEVIKRRKYYELFGTLYLGPEAVPQNDTNIKIHDKIFAKEVVVPLAKRTNNQKKLMIEIPEKRAYPLNCLSCRDDDSAPCKECGCFICSGKEPPKEIILCDECNKGFHMSCLSPPLDEIPQEDWYCQYCKRDPNVVIAPGAAKQAKKTSTRGTKDWGRGMACVGKTKSCDMPANHFGPIPGIEVGMRWLYRIQASECGVHRPPVGGIHGRDVEGAYSIVLSGGYEDDQDNGYEFTYTGSGGRDLSGNKRTAEQSCDQTLTRENKALARNCAVKAVNNEGSDAGDDWRLGKPVRVVRSYKMSKHFPKYAPKSGIRYDGIYKVVRYYPEVGLSGFRVWKFLLRRDDPSPAPWEPEAKQFDIEYPEGYLEAEAEKLALKNKAAKKGKKPTQQQIIEELTPSNSSTCLEMIEVEPKVPKKSLKDRCVTDVLPSSAVNSTSDSEMDRACCKPISPKKCQSPLTDEELEAIKADSLNAKVWAGCLEACDSLGKKEFVARVMQEFLCIICQEVAADPVTTPCLHNFCQGCLKLSLRMAPGCPYCRGTLARCDITVPNNELKTALQTILKGYDQGRRKPHFAL